MPRVTVENPLLRVPVSLIVDDSAPLINLAHYWIHDVRKQPADHLPKEIPASFARRFGEWAIENGVRGKFSLIPMPAGLGRIDQIIPGWTKEELEEWLDVAKGVIWQNFDLTPEMITHLYAVNLKDWTMLDKLEQYTWTEGKSEEELTEYIAAALRILRNVGIVAEGVTSPGGFGNKVIKEYARATLAAEKAVNGISTPFYFKEVELRDVLPPRVKYVDKEKGEAVVSIIACTGDWFGGWTGYDLGDADHFITADLHDGRMLQVIDAGVPAVMCGHWPGLYFGGEEKGFNICKIVVDRLNCLDNVIWMKTSEITRYWCAREMVDLQIDEKRIRIVSPIDCKNFTIRIEDAHIEGCNIAGDSLTSVESKSDLHTNSYFTDGCATFLATNLKKGVTNVEFL